MAYKGMALLNSLLLVMWNLVINSQQLSLPRTTLRSEGTDKVDGTEATWTATHKGRSRSSVEQLITGIERLDSTHNENDLRTQHENHYQKFSENYLVLKRIFHRQRRGDPEPSAAPSEPKGSSEPANNPNSTSEPKPEPVMWPEPEPDWDIAIEKWKAAWPLHVYGFATVLILLGIISLFELVRIHVRSRRKTSLKVSLLLMILIFCSTRATALYIGPYGSNASINPIIVRLLFSIGYPCLISAMSLLLLVLIDTTKMNIAPPSFQRVQIIIVVVVFHVILTFTTDIVVAFYIQTKVLILICQIYYFLMGLILSIGYARVGWKIAKNSSANVIRDRKMEKLKVLIIVASITGMVMVVISIYGTAGVFGIFSDVTIVEAWPWWSFQTLARTVEVVMVIVLLFMNINVSGSGFSVRELFSNCKKKLIKNKVDSENSQFNVSSAVAYSNSWMVPSTGYQNEA